MLKKYSFYVYSDFGSHISIDTVSRISDGQYQTAI